MSKEMKLDYQIGETDIWFTVWNESDQVAVVTAGVWQSWTTWNNSNVGDYDTDADDRGGGRFDANFPTSTPAGNYTYKAHQGAKDGTADGLGSESIIWDGSAEIEVSSPFIIPAGYIGDYKLLETVYFNFSTNKTLTENGESLKVYKNNETSQLSTAQATLDVDIDTNVHSVSIVLGAANYDTEEDYNVVLSGATIGGETVTAIVGTFSIENRWQAPKHRHIAP